MYLNKVMIIGNLTRDPEMKALPSGSNVTTFSVATNRYYKDAQGAKQEAVEYHNIVVFGRQAETSNQYLKKGQNVMIEGRLQTRSWDDKDTGQKKYRSEIVAESVQFGAKTVGAPSNGDNNSSANQPADEAINNIDYSEEVNPDDIPF